MEVQKPFKCPVCTSRFTNEDHLQVHKRRHEMSLNLGKSGGGLTAQALESFVEETPSPTRFFRNCEEVGLFQDLQNVNPFDEQFSKATSATPSTENFEFHFSVSTTMPTPACTIPSSLSMRRSADQDTLNTPQVIGYPAIISSSTTTTTSTSSIITSVLNSTTPLSISTSHTISSSKKTAENSELEENAVTNIKDTNNEATNNNINESSVTKVQNPGISTTTTATESPSVFTGDNIIKFQGECRSNSEINSSGLKVNNSHQQKSSFSPVKSRSKSNLRLTLTPQCDISDAEASTSISASSSNSNVSIKSAAPLETAPVAQEIKIVRSYNDTSKSQHDVEQIERKAELLERNRAAASRSRERRKQWMSDLESKNQVLLLSLTRSRAEIQRLRSENQILREHLTRHSDCDVTKAETKSQQPHILKQNTNIIMNPTTMSTFLPAQPNTDPAGAALPVSTPHPPVIAARPLNISKPKRGRPRKGQEKRVEIVCVPASASSNCEIPVKVQILPMSHPVPSRIVVIPPLGTHQK